MWATYLTRSALLLVYLAIIARYEHLPLPRRH